MRHFFTVFSRGSGNLSEALRVQHFRTAPKFRGLQFRVRVDKSDGVDLLGGFQGLGLPVAEFGRRNWFI